MKKRENPDRTYTKNPTVSIITEAAIFSIAAFFKFKIGSRSFLAFSVGL